MIKYNRCTMFKILFGALLYILKSDNIFNIIKYNVITKDRIIYAFHFYRIC